MRILSCMVAALAVGLMSVGSSVAQGDMDCSDFRSWREAQAFYESEGPGDPHGLDRDGDGIACETLR